MSGDAKMEGAEADAHIATTPAERLVYMANQMARFFASQKHDAAVVGVAEHIAKFWDPRMKTQIIAHLRAGGAGLLPLAKEAVAMVHDRSHAQEIARATVGRPGEDEA